MKNCDPTVPNEIRSSLEASVTTGETGTTWCFFMKTTSKEFTLSSDFKWIHLLSENSSDIGKNKSDFICFGGGTSNFTETANKAEILEL